MIAIDHRSDRPGWRQLADQLRTQMRGGELRPGDRLPSEASLREMTDLNRRTIRRALRLLEIEGLVEFRPPQGTFVRDTGGQTVLGPGDWLILPEDTTVVRAHGACELAPKGTVVLR